MKKKKKETERNDSNVGPIFSRKCYCQTLELVKKKPIIHVILVVELNLIVRVLALDQQQTGSLYTRYGGLLTTWWQIH